VYYGLGRCYEQEGKPEAAADAYLAVQRSIPHLIKPRYLLAMLTYHQNDTTAFLEAASACIAFEPKIYNMEVVRMKQELRELMGKMTSKSTFPTTHPITE